MKIIKKLFNLTLAIMLTMTQTAWATDDVTVTYRLITGTKGVIKANVEGNEQNVITPIGSTIKTKSSGHIINSTDNHETADLLITPFVNGTIKQVKFTNIGRRFEAAFGDASFYFGIEGMKYGNADAVTETGDDGSFTFTSSTGISTSNNLTIKLGAESSIYIRNNCDLVITYEPSAASVHSHDFTFNAVGNTLTAICGHSDGQDCSLADANYQATLTLSPSVDTYYRPGSTYSATLNLTAFNALTGLNATATDITYVNNTTGNNLGTAAPTAAGNYTASVTVTIGGTDYTLTTDFKVNTENGINSNIRQISVSKTNAANDEEITITFTPRLHELVNTLTVTGTTTNMSIGNGVTKVDEYTYTFLMPYEEVTIGATFKSSNTSLYKYAITTDLTGSGEVDYNAEEYLGAGDAITITFMPYLQGNLEAGSVVLEGLTVTGVTTNMSVGNGITDNGDNTYTFTMPDEDVTVSATAWLSADAILTGTINEPINVKQGNGIQIGYEGKHTYVNDGALPLVIHDGNTLRLVGGTDIDLDRADKNAIVCEGDATIELVANSAYHKVGVSDDSNRNSGKAVIKVSPAGKTLTIRVADESTESVNFKVESRSNVNGRNCDVIGCDEGGTCGSIVVESGEVEFWDYFNKGGKAIRTTDGTITFGYKFPDDCIYLYGNADGGCSEGTIMIEDGKQYHSDSNVNLKYSGTLDLQGKNYLGAKADKYTVTFDANGGSDVDNQTVAHGMKATEPATTREGYTFEGWKNGEDAYDFNTVLTRDTTLTAVWSFIPITTEYGCISVTQKDADATNYEVTINGSSVEDIVNCPEFTAQKVTYTRTFTTPKATIVLPFDVSQTDAAAAGTFYKFYDVSSEFHVQMQEVTDGLKAGVPYIVVPKNTTDPVTFETTTSVAFPLTEPSEFTGNSTKWTFNGRYSTKIFNTLDANELVYFFAANEQDNAKLGDFVKVAASETTRILPFRAYIRCANKTALTRGNGVTRGFPTTLPVYAISNDGNETTQIGTISIEMDDDDWYSLDGRKLSGKPNKKGLYIHKGKIVLF